MAAFVCEQCGTSFTAKSSLGRHKEVHERKKLTCDQCQVAFKTNRSLKEHVTTKTQYTQTKVILKQKKESENYNDYFDMNIRRLFIT